MLKPGQSKPYHDILVYENALVIANALQLSGMIINNIMGNEISNSLNSSKVDLEMLYNLISIRIKHRLESESIVY